MKAYAPEYGYQYQIFCRYKTEREFEHCDYARDRKELNYLLKEYRMAYGGEYELRFKMLPQKYWKEKVS